MMDSPLQVHLPELRERLARRLQELREVTAAEENARQNAGATGVHEVTDHKDDALRLQLLGLDDAQWLRDREEIADVEDALARLDAGTYGGCVDCGLPIELPRLLVMPSARRCTACQAIQEQNPPGSVILD